MSTLGKVLLLVNILLAFGVLYLASQDYTKRKALAEAAIKYQIVLDGLPVEAVKTEADPGADSYLVNVTGPNAINTTQSVSKKILDNLFSSTDAEFAGGGVPKSQVDLLDSVYNKLTANLDGMPNDGARLRFLAGYLDQGTYRPGLLMNLADTFEERQAIRNLANVPAEQFGDSVKIAREYLKRRYETAKATPNPQQPEQLSKQIEEIKAKIAANPNDPAPKKELTRLSEMGPIGPPANDLERRLRIAQMLFGVNPAPRWQQKVALTVGLKIYQLALTEQTGRLETISTQTRDLRFTDQANFDVQYEQLKSFALENSKLVDQQDRVVQELSKTLATDQSLFDQRSAQAKQLREEIAALTVEINKQLAAQKQTETNLFQVQKEVGTTLRETGRLEQELRSKELK